MAYKNVTRLAVLPALLSLLIAAPAAAGPPTGPDPSADTDPTPRFELLSDAARVSYDLPAPGPGKAWVLVAEEEAMDQVRDASGEVITTQGIYSEFTMLDVPESKTKPVRPEPIGQDDIAAAGCSVSRYVSYPYRAYYAAGRYSANAYTRITNGSGCPYNERVFARLREEQGWIQPTVDSGRITIPPGTTRSLYLTYPCGSGRYKYSHSSEGYYLTSSTYLCP